MNQNVRFIGLWRAVYYIPTLVPVMASTMLWLWIFNPEFGLLNMMLPRSASTVPFRSDTVDGR